MKKHYLAGLITPALILTPLLSHAQGSFDELTTAVKGGTATLAFRLRQENVEQDNALEDAAATTLRTRLTLKSGQYGSLSGLLEFDNVSQVGSDSYDSFVIDQYRGTYSVIADPVYTEINQASVSYKISGEQSLTAGRQRINYAKQRFVGGVGWRQNEQTYDTAGWQMRSDEFDIDYNYIWNVNRIFASSRPSVQMSDWRSDSHILLGTWKPEFGSLSGYVYALDFEDAAAMSSITYGVSYAGKFGPVSVNASLAQQSDYADAPLSYDAGYVQLDASMNVGPVKLLAGYELLGSDDGMKGFVTPLATLHAFQGWTDLFLTTPDNGVEDMYLTASGAVSGFALAATFHNFEADEGGADYGTEWDLSVGYKINAVVDTQLKFASFDSDGFAVDTDKLWLSVMVAF